jgi:hypothetical protein
MAWKSGRLVRATLRSKAGAGTAHVRYGARTLDVVFKPGETRTFEAAQFN